MHTVPYSVMVEQSSSYSSGIELIRQARREYPQLDGVFCTNDDLAVGAAFECQRLGLKVPDDMAIAGFHGHDIGQVMEPRLASVLTPRERMGSIGAERTAGAYSWRICDTENVRFRFHLVTGRIYLSLQI